MATILYHGTMGPISRLMRAIMIDETANYEKIMGPFRIALHSTLSEELSAAPVPVVVGHLPRQAHRGPLQAGVRAPPAAGAARAPDK